MREFLKIEFDGQNLKPKQKALFIATESLRRLLCRWASNETADSIHSNF